MAVQADGTVSALTDQHRTEETWTPFRVVCWVVDSGSCMHAFLKGGLGVSCNWELELGYATENPPVCKA